MPSIYSENHYHMEYIRQRLEGTVVKYNGCYARVIDIFSIDEVNIVQHDHKHTVRLKEIEDANPSEHLGLFNYTSGLVYNKENLMSRCCFVSRLPVKHDWRQGLRKNNMVYYVCESKLKRLKRVHQEYNVEEVMEASRTTIFPSIEKAMEKIEDGSADNVALSRSIALMQNGSLSVPHEGDSLLFGKVNRDNGKITVDLPANKEYLMDEITDILEAN